ncbi:hypothetical protein IM793_16325 [Pedobacter sp. MR2016-19]|uniref:hypothetical protein n=1 Tax=Pedobacter sp. MR2016-19 TaxID=2780089 RepID=UPI0018769055|nr:hypothetical protein [Pedobacter sp. MR2016-19]MBE5320737.1 hypothetical protein [Pedobacter sp. MR2016-19]
MDWEKIVLRISSDAKRSINYYVPILNDNQPCNKALELSFGTEKNIFQATVRTYITTSATAGSSSETRRLQTILYNFSTMGLTIPQTVINREKTIQKELKQKNIASVKNQKMSLTTKDRAGSSITQYIRTCETAITFDFYYQFSGYRGDEYSVQNKSVEIANYFRTLVFGYMKNNLNLDYEMPLYGHQNDMVFYNITDNDQLGNMIHVALDYAAYTTGSFWNLQQSWVGYYYIDVLYSTCGGSSGGGGGTPGTPTITAEELPEAVPVANNIPKIQDIKKYTKCFADGKPATYKMTIFVDQPVKGQGDWYNIILPTGGVVTNNPYNVPTGIIFSTINGDNFDVGHTFVTFEKNNLDGTSVKQTLGFYPSESILANKGTMVNNSSHAFDVSYTIDVTQQQFNNGLAKVEGDFATKNYVLTNVLGDEYNCTDAAISWMNAAGATFTNSTSGLFKNTPGNFGQTLRSLPGADTISSVGTIGKGPCN